MILRNNLGALSRGLFLIAHLSFASAGLAGDSFYGIVTEVKHSDLVIFNYGPRTFEVRIAGVDVPQDPALAAEATRFVSELVLNKNCRLRLKGRNRSGEMVGRLLTDDPVLGIKDIGTELVRLGLVLRQPNYTGYKYGELVAAETEAKQSRRGVWKTLPK
jgi:endonuclease YncB( thermonuclease family)